VAQKNKRVPPNRNRATKGSSPSKATRRVVLSSEEDSDGEQTHLPPEVDDEDMMSGDGEDEEEDYDMEDSDAMDID
jgi:hypothetical protein